MNSSNRPRFETEFEVQARQTCERWKARQAAAVATPAAASSVQQSAKTEPMKKFDNTRPATLAELKAAFPGDAAYVLEAAQARKTMLLAKADYGDVLAERPEPARNADIGPLGGRGSAVISSGRSIRPAAQTYDSGDGAADFEQAVEDEMKKQGAGVNRKKAVAAVCKKRPDLHRAYLERNNPGRRERALIAQKYDRDEE